ncbi:MAG: DtxR family transcriptional regulator, Mn-dependent transcriptional regulator [Chloroflexota bacterium]|jgi:DtxR family Mn-dependent transcriptional regulator|nr:DtxR family transcriptional regulator, Mn-dependent transcriptional regulator [Chloroflexota bacterium]
MMAEEQTQEGAPPEAHRTETVDRYLECVYYIAHEGETVRPSRLADWLGVSAPTVSVNLQRLERDGWVGIARDRSVSLTPRGEEVAARIVRRHRLLERWLTDVLGLDWATADREAGRLAHGFSDLVLERLNSHLGEPVTCPHGNTIPGRPPRLHELIALADLEPNTPARIARISEVAEHEAPELLRLLDTHGLVPGAEVEIAEMDGGAGALAVSVGGHHVALGTSKARAIWVEVG